MFVLTILAGDWSSFFGHFHPVIVHLPIGMLVIAFLLEIVAIRSHNTQWDTAIAFIFLYGTVGAVLSALLGWLFSLSGNYDRDALFAHQWGGIAVAILSALSYYLKRKAINPNLKKAYWLSICTTLVFLIITGHLGGSITHGESYLTTDLPSPISGLFGMKKNVPSHKKITNLNEAAVYSDIISPVLETRCWNCHGENKSKGKLRMDSWDLLMKGGKDGPIIKKNDAANSEIIRRLLLPVDDDQRMPPKGKEPVTNDEISMIKWWIDIGAEHQKKVKELKADNATLQLLARIAGNGKTVEGIAEDSNSTSQPAIFSRKIAPASQPDINALKKLSILVSPIAQGQNYLSVSCINNPDFNDKKIMLLMKLRPQLAWLQLNYTSITDEALITISRINNLVRLNLANTNLTGKNIGLLTALSNLEYLNLTGTNINDNALKQLSTLPNIRHIYCWQTQVTQQGVAAFKVLKPQCKVELGGG